MKISTRIGGRVTSITVKDNLAALYCTVMGTQKDPYNSILNACYEIMNDWDGDSGKGLSQYVSDRLILDMLEPDEHKDYKKVLKKLQD